MKMKNEALVGMVVLVFLVGNLRADVEAPALKTAQG